MGATFDWDAEVVTCDPEYYRWNQWLFLRFLEAGLAYRAKSPVDWCPNDGTLAREQVEGADRHCWRCGAKVEKRDLEQWYLRVTQVRRRAARLQRHRLARSRSGSCRRTGSAGPRAARSSSRPRPSAHHAGRRGAARLHDPAGHALRGDVHGPRPGAPARREADRARPPGRGRGLRRRRAAGPRSSGCRPTARRPASPIGADAINPVNGERIPIFDRRLRPGRLRHRRDHGRPRPRRARLRVRREVRPADPAGRARARPREPRRRAARAARTSPPRPRTSGSGQQRPVHGLRADEGGDAIVDELGEQGTGRAAVTYRLRDWLISRQRYWGTPIPVIYCADATGSCPVPDEDLPVLLPDDRRLRRQRREPADPRRGVPERRRARSCGGPAQRETDTMDTFIDSSWYWFRYLSPAQGRRAGRPGPGRGVDARSTSTPAAPSTRSCTCCTPRSSRRRCATSGLVQRARAVQAAVQPGPDPGRRRRADAKVAGNVQDPDELVARYGADTVRLFLMFMGPWDQGGPWSPTGIGGVHRFLNRVWTIALDPHGVEPGDPEPGTLPAGETDARRAARRSGRPPTGRCATSPPTTRRFHFNTMVAQLMELANLLMRYRGTSRRGPAASGTRRSRLLLLMLAPAAPHITEELWSRGSPRPASRGRRSTRERWPDGRRIRDRRGDPRGPGPGDPKSVRNVHVVHVWHARPRKSCAAVTPGRRYSVFATNSSRPSLRM